jgi:AraC family transcriptional regulator of adaptative response / DNA-3-methyladenine glycosylase II
MGVPDPDPQRRGEPAGRALWLLGDGIVEREGVAGLAARLGRSVSAVDRLLVAEVGIGAEELAQAVWPETDEGFQAPRSAGEPIELRLPYRPPLAADRLIAYLGVRAVPGIEEVSGGRYRRSLRLPLGMGVVELAPADGHLAARVWLEHPRDLVPAVRRIRDLMDLDGDPGAVIDVLGADPLLGPLVRAVPGRRVAGHVDGHELAVRAVLGQQISLAAAATHAARLVLSCGRPLAHPVGGVTHAFPSPSELAAVDPESLAMPRSRRRALLAVAEAMAAGELVLDPGVERDEALGRLLALPGVGPWTAAYVALRVLRDVDAFMPTDLGVRHALRRLGRPGDPAAAVQLAERWRPYRGYALQYLWALLAEAPTG